MRRRAKTEAARRHFNRWAAGTYERDRVSQWLGQIQLEAVSALELQSGDSFLDIGCGTGAAVREAAQRVERAVGLDLSPAMIARARTLAEGLVNVEFSEGDWAGGCRSPRASSRRFSAPPPSTISPSRSTRSGRSPACSPPAVGS